MSETPFIKFINIIYVLSFAIFILFLYFKSSQGVQGIQGIQGLQGLQGNQGLPGPTGLQGQRGERGSAGQSFSIVQSYANLIEFNAANKLQYQTVGNAILLISDGSLMIWTTANEWIDAGDIKGNDGEIGPQGPQGLQGPVGNTGPQGVQGEQGNKGDTGLQGQKGDTGLQGLKGDTGLQGQKGDTGDKGDTGLQGLKGDKGDKGDAGDTVIALQYGSFYDLSSQFSGVANTIQAIQCNFTLFNKGIQIINSTGGQLNASRLKILIAGRYNIQFSIQLHQENSNGIVNIWLRKNGTDVEYSNTKLSIASNNPYLVAAWNFFVDASINDYYELIWSSNHSATKIEYLPESNGHPAVPSVILTIHQIGL